MSDSVELSLVVPCYNEEGHLADSVDRIVRALTASGTAFEIIFVEDCSTDDTRRVVRELAARHAQCRAIYHERNQGRGGSFRSGALAAAGSIVGFVDIDLEVGEQYIPGMVQAVRDGADVATGRRHIRFSARPYDLLRHAMSLGYSALYRLLLRLPTRDPETGFKFFRRERLLELFQHTTHGGWFFDTQVMAYSALLGLRVEELPCEFIRRPDKKSTIRLVGSTVDQTRELLRFALSLRRMRRSGARWQYAGTRTRG